MAGNQEVKEILNKTYRIGSVIVTIAEWGFEIVLFILFVMALLGF